MFNITLEAGILLNALNYLEPTVGKASSNTTYNCIFMESTSTGSVILTTTNGTELTKVELIVAIGTQQPELAPIIDFKRFKNIITSIPESDHVTLKQDPNNTTQLVIQHINKNITLVGNAIGASTNPVCNGTPIAVSIPVKEMETAINNCASIVKPDAKNGIFNYCMLATDGTKCNFEMTAYDATNVRMVANSGSTSTMNPFINEFIDIHKFKKSLKIFEDFFEVKLSSYTNLNVFTGADPRAAAECKSGGMVVSVTYYTAKPSATNTFPTNISATCNEKLNGTILVGKEELLSSINNVKAIDDDLSQHSAKIEYGNGTVKVSSTSLYGSVENSFKTDNVNSIHQNINAAFKYDLLSDIIRSIPTEDVEIASLPKNPSYFVIKPAQSTNAIYIVPSIAPQPQQPQSGNNP